MQSTYYPWTELINAFVDNIPKRLELMEASAALSLSPLQELNEFRILSIGGPRQCGKTEALLNFMINHEHVKLNTRSFYQRYFESRLGEAKFAKIYMDRHTLHHLTSFESLTEPNPFVGIKFMIFDNAEDEAFHYFTQIFNMRRDWFDPDFMVISVL